MFNINLGWTHYLVLITWFKTVARHWSKASSELDLYARKKNWSVLGKSHKNPTFLVSSYAIDSHVGRNDGFYTCMNGNMVKW
jgi:hypothetical protein